MSNSSFEIIKSLKKQAPFIAAIAIAFVAALGIAFQNTTAFAEFLINSWHFATEIALPVAIVSGGIFSGGANFFLNVPLLENIFDRIRGRIPSPNLPTWGKKLQYGAGIGIFLVTGILFGLAAISIGATGGLAILALVAGVFVVLVTIPQELETWLESFDDPITVAIHKSIYDCEQLEENVASKEFCDLVDELKKNLKKIRTKEGLKALKEDYLQAAEKTSQERKKQIAQVIDNCILHFEKHDDLNEFIKECSNRLQDTELNNALNNLKNTIEEEQSKLELLKQELLNQAEIEKKRWLLAQLDALKQAQIQKETEEQQKISLIDSIFDRFKKWWRDLTWLDVIALLICLGNVVALSLQFTIGLAGFFIAYLGVAAFPAVVIGFVVAFTFGAFTEFYFYHYFLADFCNHIEYKWRELTNSPNWGFGILQVFVNAVVNGVLGYTGVALLSGILVAAGIAAPPLLGLAIVTGVFACLASLLLCSDFWIKTAGKFFGEEEKKIEENEVEDNPSNNLFEMNDKQNKTTKKLVNDQVPLVINAEKIEMKNKSYDWIFAPLAMKESPKESSCFGNILSVNH